jgi:hypothetical protein
MYFQVSVQRHNLLFNLMLSNFKFILLEPINFFRAHIWTSYWFAMLVSFMTLRLSDSDLVMIIINPIVSFNKRRSYPKDD